MADYEMKPGSFEAGAYGKGALWAIGGIIVIATIYEVNRKAGLALAVIALMGMALTYIPRFGLRFETGV
jgi:hypothetical protein